MDLESLIENVVRRVLREELAATRATPMADELVTIATFARARSISVSVVRKHIRTGRLEAVRIGKAVRLRRDAQVGPAAGSAPPATAAATSMERALRILKGRP